MRWPIVTLIRVQARIRAVCKALGPGVRGDARKGRLSGALPIATGRPQASGGALQQLVRQEPGILAVPRCTSRRSERTFQPRRLQNTLPGLLLA